MNQPIDTDKDVRLSTVIRIFPGRCQAAELRIYLADWICGVIDTIDFTLTSRPALDSKTIVAVNSWTLQYIIQLKVHYSEPTS